jgi:LPPG:FO 2-phospho-L-lactate transferase
VREALRACPAPVVAVSPIIGGKAVKGPTAKMMAELGLPVGADAVARHYGDVLDHYVIDEADIAATESPDLPFTATRTLMETVADRDALARVVLAAGRGF